MGCAWAGLSVMAGAVAAGRVDGGAAGAAERADFRYSAAVTVQRSAAFVELALPPAAYVHSAAPELADLRLFDAAGARVPYAWLPVPAPPPAEERLKDAALYALPPRPTPGAGIGLPVEVRIEGERILVRREAAPTTAGRPAVAPPDSPGWLFDLGEPRQRPADEAAPAVLRLAWSGPASFSAAYDLDTSADLRAWQAAGSGQVMALPGTPALQQREVQLPPAVPRFVRLVWRAPEGAPQLTGAAAVVQRSLPVRPGRATELRFAATPEPPSKWAQRPAWAASVLHFDLGAALPLESVALQLPPGSRVAPVRLQGRLRSDEPWRELGAAVFYQLERDGRITRSPVHPLETTLRYLRVLPDERAGALDPAATQLVVSARLAHLVFPAQGQPPYRLLIGAAGVADGALPVQTLVPSLAQERDRFGSAQLGEFTEQADAAQRIEARQRRAALQPVLLWTLLLGGVAALGFMVWRLMASRPSGAGEQEPRAPSQP